MRLAGRCFICSLVIFRPFSASSQKHIVRSQPSLSSLANPCSRSPLQLPPLPATLQPPRSVYVHIPFCRRRCYYCDFPIVVTGDASLKTPGRVIPEEDNYISALLAEVQASVNLYRAFYQDTHPSLETVYFGGGTPSLLSSNGLRRVLEALERAFGFSEDCEFTIEMDPGTFGKEKMWEFVQLGINRVSLGAQAFRKETLKRIGRAHDVEDIYGAVEGLREGGVKNWSIDVMCGLPDVDNKEWNQTLEEVVELEPPHVSVYDLQVEESTRFGRMAKRGRLRLPAEQEEGERLKKIWSMLKKRKWEHYEVSNFAKLGFRSRHNQMYWRNEAYYGFGMGATSFFNGYRFPRPKKLNKYYEYVDCVSKGNNCDLERIFPGCARVTSEEYLADFLITRFRLLGDGLNLSEVARRFGAETKDTIVKTVKRLGFEKTGLVEFVKELDCLRLSDPEGVLLENFVISAILRETVWR